MKPSKFATVKAIALLVLTFSWHVRAGALALGKPWRKHQLGRNEIVVHRIKSPRILVTYKIDDLELSIDDPELYYDHMREHRHDNSFYYLATVGNKTTVIGMVEVLADIVDKGGDLPGNATLQGLFLDNVLTAKKFYRQGVACTLFEAIERDAGELMRSMNQYYQNGVKRIKRRSDGGVVIRLHSVSQRKALRFYSAWEILQRPKKIYKTITIDLA